MTEEWNQLLIFHANGDKYIWPRRSSISIHKLKCMRNLFLWLNLISISSPDAEGRVRRLWKFYSVHLGLFSLPTLSGNVAISLAFCQERALRLVCNTEGEGVVPIEALGLQSASSPTSFPQLSQSAGATQPAGILGGTGGPDRIQRRGSSKASRGSVVWGGTEAHPLVLSSHPIVFLYSCLLHILQECFPLQKGKQYSPMIFLSNILSIHRDSPLS